MTWAASIARLLLRYGWSPIGKPTWLIIDDSGDAHLTGLILDGTVRAFDLTVEGTVSRLLVELRQPLAYRGHYSRRGIQWLVGESCLAERRASLLPLAWSAVRVVDAPSFTDSTYDRTIAVARLVLGRPKSGRANDNPPIPEEESATASPGMTIDERLAVHVGHIVTSARSIGVLLEDARGAHQLAEIGFRARRVLDLVEGLLLLLPSPRLNCSRDSDLMAVLAHIKNALQSMEALSGPEHDQALDALECFARPYALALYYEVCRLEEVLA